MLPTFIGIGVVKAGTTWLFRCLREHPEIFVAKVKETKFFIYDTIDNRLPQYEAHFVGAEGFRAAGEISPQYFASELAAVRIKECVPDVRLFLSLRNPIAQVYSHYWHALRQNFHRWGRQRLPGSFEEALEMYPDLLIRPAFYASHLARWLQYFERSQLHVMFHDDIRASPLEVLRGLFDFLGVDTSFRPPSVNQSGASVRRGTSPRSPLMGRVHSRLYDALNRHVYHHAKQVLGRHRAIRLKDALRIREGMEFIFRRRGYPEMNPATRVWLRERFADDIAALSAMTSRDLSHWS